MAAKNTPRAESPGSLQTACLEETSPGIVLEADYPEDRPISLLAERQREFQKSLQGQYIDAEMPVPCECG